MERVKRFIVAAVVAAFLVGTAGAALAGAVEDRDKIASGQQQSTSSGR
jgi:hypothetical protein